MEFIPQNALEESLLKGVKDVSYRPRFYQELVKAEIFVVKHGPISEETSEIEVVKNGFNFQIQNLPYEGKYYIPFFSSIIRLQQFARGKCNYIAINALDLFKILKDSEFFLNPGSDYMKIFSKSEVASIIDGSMWTSYENMNFRKGGHVRIGIPASYPQELVDAFIGLFKRTPEVTRAYLGNICQPDLNEKPHTLVAVEVTGNWEYIISLMSVVVKNVKIPDPPVDIIKITGKGGLEEYFLDKKPFYEKV